MSLRSIKTTPLDTNRRWHDNFSKTYATMTPSVYAQGEAMDWQIIHQALVFIQRGVSVIGILIIISGVLYCLCQYLYFIFTGQLSAQGAGINGIRLSLGRILILGLEFIVAADLIGTTTTPDYYAVGLLGIIVLTRTVLSFSINRELMSIGKEQL